MKLMTWNIFWLGYGPKIQRSPGDEQVIAQVIRALAPDVLALQEIVDGNALVRILEHASAPGRRYSAQAPSGNWLSSHSKASTNRHTQKIFLCFNQDTVEIVRSAPVSTVHYRPMAADVRCRATGRIVTVVSVHLKSGQPRFLDSHSAATRRKQASSLARWLRGESREKHPSLTQPGPLTVVLGDFNARIHDPNHSLDPLRQGSLIDWKWCPPAPDGEHAHTAIVDKEVIDYLLLSPGAAERVLTGPQLFAFDHDHRFGGPGAFHQPSALSEHSLLRISDHRPVSCQLALA